MRNTLGVIIVLLTCLLILPCPKDVNSAEWKQHFKGCGLLYFNDAKSIILLPNNIIRVWTKYIPQSEEDRVKHIQDTREIVQTMPENWDNWASTQVLYDINCKNRTFKTLEFSHYATENEGKID